MLPSHHSSKAWISQEASTRLKPNRQKDINHNLLLMPEALWHDTTGQGSLHTASLTKRRPDQVWWPVHNRWTSGRTARDIRTSNPGQQAVERKNVFQAATNQCRRASSQGCGRASLRSQWWNRLWQSIQSLITGWILCSEELYSHTDVFHLNKDTVWTEMQTLWVKQCNKTWANTKQQCASLSNNMHPSTVLVVNWRHCDSTDHPDVVKKNHLCLLKLQLMDHISTSYLPEGPSPHQPNPRCCCSSHHGVRWMPTWPVVNKEGVPALTSQILCSVTSFNCS